MFMDMAPQLAALPFLPRGKGALILILGGLVVLPFSLLWSRISSKNPRFVEWVAGIEDGAARLGLGPCTIVAADMARCVVSLAACPTCRQNRRHAGPCERERRGLELAAKMLAPRATVVEVACNPSGQGACTFEIQRGRSA